MTSSPEEIMRKTEKNNNLSILTCAIDFIESHLCEEFTQEQLAQACYCSLSGLQKLWRYCTHCSIKEYVEKRRLTNSAKEIIDTDATVLDIAVKYGYNSHEAFTRAFSRVWKCTPSEFRKNKLKSCGLYPKLNKDYFMGADTMGNKKFDINDAYDYFVSMSGTYVLCFDIKGLHAINCNIGREVGDAIILEVLNRLNNAADDMTVLRIGGDEFVMFTGIDNVEKVNEIAKAVLSHNGEPVQSSDGPVPVSVRCGAVTIRKPFKYTALLADFDTVIDKSRQDDGIAFI